MSKKKLQQLFAELSEKDQHALLRYAEFLHTQAGQNQVDQNQNATEKEAAPATPEQPVGLPRPAQEIVVAAIRRLAKNYPMLNHDRLLKQSADLMTMHLVQGRPAPEVIDELEALFLDHYNQYLEQFRD